MPPPPCKACSQPFGLSFELWFIGLSFELWFIILFNPGTFTGQCFGSHIVPGVKQCLPLEILYHSAHLLAPRLTFSQFFVPMPDAF